MTPELALATLASDTALAVALTGAADGAYRLISTMMTFALRSLTVGEGPITVGFAHSDYTVAEIKECLESQAAISAGSKIEREQSDRLVRIVGVFLSEANQNLNDGKPIKTRLNWLINIGDFVNVFVFNEDSGALQTGALMTAQGVIWVKDSD